MRVRGRRLGACALVVAGMLCIASVPPVKTEAAWSDAEIGTGAGLVAGAVSVPTGLQCSAAVGLLGPVTFTWTAPAGGLARDSYRWTVTGGLAGTGTLPTTATSVSLTSPTLGLGTGTFRLYAVGPGGWEASPVSGTITFVLGVASVCTVP
ncbi:hypothetical protein R8Z57_13230 [Microbacterium sp. M3]|uniref:Ig-like domain-containing protein n=1 Tax=Microbacterium arthrosphaerae TaxID=792652 RepID=A0ABU4H320_9MICO|nr:MULTISPECIES: hypothetical protein [Microbacterium]MDW4573737.1 hypothetical protein [Microbacterium arthrosphaerae]MDW7607592.1 hypothetical protein [Microbacterium sp. M3]